MAIGAGFVASMAAANTATIGFAGYRGAETLADFPALIKLPDCAEGFAYADAAENGADIYFTDAGWRGSELCRSRQHEAREAHRRGRRTLHPKQRDGHLRALNAQVLVVNGHGI